MATEPEAIESDDDIFDSMLDGTFEEPSSNEEDVSESTDDDTSDDDVEQEEDTDQETESDDESDLDQDGDGDLDKEEGAADDVEEEDTLVETDSSEEDGDSEDDSDDESDGTSDDTSDKDTTDTEAETDGQTAETTAGIDYKAFYDALNVDITVNGKTVKGFTDPNKLIASQQKAGGFDEKMTGIKKFRPYMAPLKERGMLDDAEKFNLAMNLVDGDVNAIKHHIKALGIDPLELDMETIAYEGKDNRASQAQMSLEETMDTARSRGIEDRVRQVIGSEWDESSFSEFVSNSAVRNDLLQHMSDGSYEQVLAEISDIKRTDVHDTFSSLSSVNQYRQAVKSLSARNQQTYNAQMEQQEAQDVSTATVEAEKAKILKSRKEDEFKVKAAAREKKVTEQRKKATSVSKRKKKTTSAKPKFDPLSLEGTDLDEMMNQLIESGHRG